MAHREGLNDVFVHCFMDGRDVDPQAGVTYVDQIQAKMDELHFGHIADIGGRYWANCWNAHSSNTIKSAVNERAALGELGKHLNTESGSDGK